MIAAEQRSARIMSANHATSGTPERNHRDREKTCLALLCQISGAAQQRRELELLLADYRWQSPDHRTIFDALAGWRATPEAIRAGLPARLTRLGFPDIEIEEYFAPIEPPVEAALEAALAWLRKEVAASAEKGQSAERAAPAQNRATGRK